MLPKQKQIKVYVRGHYTVESGQQVSEREKATQESRLMIFGVLSLFNNYIYFFHGV